MEICATMVPMTTSDKNTQKMQVTVTYEYDAEVFDGEDNDMYAVAKEEEKFLQGEFDFLINEELQEVNNIKVAVKPRLA